MLRANNSKENGFVTSTSRFSFHRPFFGQISRAAARILFGLLTVFLLGTGCVACAEKDEPTVLSYDGIAVEDYICVPAYTGLTVTLADADASKSDAIWNTVLNAAEILSYPEEPVQYYRRQGQAVYRHYADQNGMTYEEALSAHGVNEEQLLADAEALVKSDLLCHYIIRHANITLSEQEKETFYNRYADRLAEQYGYRRSYIDEHLQTEVYDAMLYDKMMEYLILHNDFSVSE